MSSSSTNRQQEAAMMRRYKELIQTAEDAHDRGDRRLAADKYLEAFHIAPSKWTEDRYICFVMYTVLVQDLSELGVDATPPDKKAIKRIAKDETEPTLFRTQALKSLGTIAFYIDDYEKAANYFRREIDVISAASHSERNRRVKMSDVRTMSVGDVLDEKLMSVNSYLNKLENPLHSTLR